MAISVPPWCRVGRGRSNLLLIAPHGGRRPPVDPAAPRERKVNDLYTADLAGDLAARLGTSSIINDGRDRNEVDLNRINQVRQRAPWLFDLLIQELESLLERHSRVQVLIIHGWNTGQPKCDLGVGGMEVDGVLRPLGDAALSVTAEYWASRVARFRGLCADTGIAAPVGERYPAAHRNNLLQLFTPRFAESADPRLRQVAAWMTAGRLNAIQLELGIPLRWPGAPRRAFLAAAARAFGEDGDERSTYRASIRPAAPAIGVLGFHFHDPENHLTLFTSITPAGALTTGRLLLFLGGQEIALFTGEEPDRRRAVGGLEYAIDGDGFTLRFDGYASRLADAVLYLDLEAALAASVLASISLDLRYEPLVDASTLEPRAGRFSGTMQIGDRRIRISARGFFDPAVALRGPGSHTARTHVAAAFDDETAFSLRIAEGESVLRGLLATRGRIHAHPHGRLVMTHDGDSYTPKTFELQLASSDSPVIAHALARMPIVRPLSDGAHARVTFGPARFEWDGRTGWGVYEYARRVPPRAAND